MVGPALSMPKLQIPAPLAPLAGLNKEEKGRMLRSGKDEGRSAKQEVVEWWSGDAMERVKAPVAYDLKAFYLGSGSPSPL